MSRRDEGAVLLTLGRLPKALDLARALHAAGRRVLVAEPFGWHLSRVSRAVARSFRTPAPNTDRDGYLQRLADIVAREGVSLVIPVSEEIVHAAALKPRLPYDVTMFCMDQPTLLGLHDKFAFARRCRALGLDAPETLRADDPAVADLLARGDVALKPALTSAGTGFVHVARGTTTPSRDPRLIAQAFVAGDIVSTFSIAREGRLLGTVTYRGAAFSGAVAVAFARIDPVAAVDAWVSHFVAATGFTGFISFDFILDETGRAWAIECNPRANSGLHFVAPSDLAAAVLDPAFEGPLALRDARLMQQFYPMLTETQGSVFDRPRFRKNLAALWRAKDVSWARNDPLPFATMTFTSATIIAIALRRGVSLGEAATRDIGWYAADGEGAGGVTPRGDARAS